MRKKILIQIMLLILLSSFLAATVSAFWHNEPLELPALNTSGVYGKILVVSEVETIFGLTGVTDPSVVLNAKNLIGEDLFSKDWIYADTLYPNFMEDSNLPSSTIAVYLEVKCSIDTDFYNGHDVKCKDTGDLWTAPSIGINGLNISTGIVHTLRYIRLQQFDDNQRSRVGGMKPLYLTSLMQKCIDSDYEYPDGKNFYKKGTIRYQTGDGADTRTDNCRDENTVTEFYCEETTTFSATQFNCPGDCQDGACIVTECIDSDSGLDRYEKGTIRYPTGDGADTRTDNCRDENTVTEFYCEETTTFSATQVNCPRGCQDGACIGAEEEDLVLTTPPIVLALEDGASNADLKLLTDIAVNLFTREGYTTPSSNLFSEINASNLRGFVTIAVLNEEVVILLEGNASPAYHVFANVAGQIASDLGSLPTFRLSDEVISDDLKDLFIASSQAGEDSCTDTDEGIDVYQAGTVSGILRDGTFGSRNDTCAVSSYGHSILEYYCNENDQINFKRYGCANCIDGACRDEREVIIDVSNVNIPQLFYLYGRLYNFTATSKDIPNARGDIRINNREFTSLESEQLIEFEGLSITTGMTRDRTGEYLTMILYVSNYALFPEVIKRSIRPLT